MLFLERFSVWTKFRRKDFFVRGLLNLGLKPRLGKKEQNKCQRKIKNKPQAILIIFGSIKMRRILFNYLISREITPINNILKL
jgi:hypothetical protein